MCTCSRFCQCKLWRHRFKFRNALRAWCVNWTDLLSAGWFRREHTHTHTPTPAHTEWLSKQQQQHINRCNQTRKVLKRVESVTCMIKGLFQQLKRQQWRPQKKNREEEALAWGVLVCVSNSSLFEPLRGLSSYWRFLLHHPTGATGDWGWVGGGCAGGSTPPLRAGRWW